MKDNEQDVIRVITGPTACGKTALSIRLAEELNCEIVCMDSMQIYRSMDIGTAKPNARERAEIPHHLLDIADPTDTYSVSAYREDAERVIRGIRERGRNVLFVGGTVLYLKALCHPMTMGGIGSDEAFREEMHRIADGVNGHARLHAMLEQADPETAARLHENDVRRVIRALEILKLTGVPMSRREDREEETDSRFRIAVLCRNRASLYSRIEDRVDEMIRDGLENEVRALMKAGVTADCQSMQGLGYKEMIAYISGATDLPGAVRQIKTGTRHYAKRQVTFLKGEKNAMWFDASDPGVTERVAEYFRTGENKENDDRTIDF